MYFLVDDRHRFLIGWSAKAGCTAIKRWYNNALGLGISNREIHAVIGYGDTVFTNVDKFPRQHYDGYKKICLIRNPYKRLVSGYVNKYVIEQAYEQGWNNFKEFVEVLIKDRFFRKINKHHFTPQTSEAFNKFLRRKWNWDLVVDLENLDKKINTINQITGLKGTISHPNETGYKKAVKIEKPAYLMKNSEIKESMPSFEYFYSADILNKVYKKYINDFKNFRKWGFDYGPPSIQNFRGTI